VRHAYIYYRIDSAQCDLAALRVDALLNAMAAHCSLTPRRLSRCDDPLTWMEIYAGIADFPGFSAALIAAEKSIDCQAFIQGERHLECFTSADAA
jgi:hypothetical protein